MYRKYIAAVQPLSDHVLQVDFVSGSRLLSTVLVLAICMGLLPGTVFATQTGSSDASYTNKPCFISGNYWYPRRDIHGNQCS